MKECIMNIYVVDRPVPGGGDRQKSPDSDHLTTGAKVLVKSIPFCCVLPRITSWALKRPMVSLALYLILYTHLLSRACLPRVRSHFSSSILFQGINFMFHGNSSLSVKNSVSKSSRLKNSSDRCNKFLISNIKFITTNIKM